MADVEPAILPSLPAAGNFSGSSGAAASDLGGSAELSGFLSLLSSPKSCGLL